MISLFLHRRIFSNQFAQPEGVFPIKVTKIIPFFLTLLFLTPKVSTLHQCSLQQIPSFLLLSITPTFEYKSLSEKYMLWPDPSVIHFSLTYIIITLHDLHKQAYHTCMFWNKQPDFTKHLRWNYCHHKSITFYQKYVVPKQLVSSGTCSAVGDSQVDIYMYLTLLSHLLGSEDFNITSQVFKGVKLYIFSLMIWYNLTSDDLWPWYMTFGILYADSHVTSLNQVWFPST